MTAQAAADTFEWIDPVSGTFSDGANWNNTTGVDLPPPNIGDQLRFNEPGTYTVTFKQNEASDEFAVTDGTVAFLSDSATLRTLSIATGQRDGNISGGTLKVGTPTNPVFLNLNSAVSGSILNVGSTAGDGTLIINGSQSRVDALGTGSHNVGRNGSTGMLTLDNAATANYGGTLRLGVNTGSDGQVTVDGGSTLNSNHIAIASDTTNAVGTFTVTDVDSTVSQTTPGATLTVGSASGGAGTIDVKNGGTFTTGTGTTTINATGTLNVGIVGTGTFNANGPVNVDGGTFNLDISSTTDFNLASGQTLTASNNAQINFDSYTLRGGRAFEINSGADLSTIQGFSIGGLGAGTSTLIVDGAGSSVTIGGFSGTSMGTTNGNTTDVTFRQQATGDLSNLSLGDGAAVGGHLSVESASFVSTGDILIATNFASDQTIGTLTVDGPGSLVTQTLAGATLTVGRASGTGSGTINVQSGGTFTTGTGTTTINATGTVNVGVLGDGTFNANGPVILDGGTLNVLNPGDAFNLAVGQTLTASNNAQINLGAYGLNGGTTFEINSGADLSLSSFFTVGTGLGGGNGTLVVDGAGSSVSSGSSSWGGSGNTASATFRQHATGDLGPTLITNGPAAGSIGTLTIESGAAVTTANLGMATVDGEGSTALVVIDGAGSSLTQNGAATLTVGNSSGGSATINAQNGGTLTTGTGTTTINATGTLNIGMGMTGGTFNANGPVTIDGAVNLIDGQMSAGMVTLNGGGAFNFTGGALTVDTFQGVLIQDGGTLLIGGSPGATDITQDYTMNAGTLEIELFGSGGVAGTDFDQVNVTGNVNLAGGSLDVSVMSPFTPSLGDSFEIMDVGGSLTGTFSGLSQGALVGNFGGTDLFINYASGDGNDISLVATQAGDFDFDFAVDGFDFLKWQRGFGSTFDSTDLIDWEANYGMVAPIAAASAAVPEPTALLLAAMASLIGVSERRRS